jgi:Cu/Ag efflux pump CusA
LIELRPFDYGSLFISLGVMHYFVLYFAYFRQFTAAELTGRAPRGLPGFVWGVLTVGFFVVYAALVFAARMGAVHEDGLGRVSTVLLLVSVVDSLVLQARVRRARDRQDGVAR